MMVPNLTPFVVTFPSLYKNVLSNMDRVFIINALYSAHVKCDFYIADWTKSY